MHNTTEMQIPRARRTPKCPVVLNVLLREEDNKYCVECNARGKAIDYVFLGVKLIKNVISGNANW